MVLILDGGNSEKGVHVRRNLFDLICLRHLIRLRAVGNRIFSEKTYFLYTCATCSEIPTNLSPMSPTLTDSRQGWSQTRSQRSSPPHPTTSEHLRKNCMDKYEYILLQKFRKYALMYIKEFFPNFI